MDGTALVGEVGEELVLDLLAVELPGELQAVAGLHGLLRGVEVHVVAYQHVGLVVSEGHEEALVQQYHLGAAADLWQVGR